MTFHKVPTPAERTVETARDWVRILADYRQPDTKRSIWELTVTLLPFLSLWALAGWALSLHWALAMGIAAVNGMFLLRLFAIQHDCGHGSFLDNRRARDWIGRCLGVLTMTPYDVWRRCHAIHHSASGNLDSRGIGDLDTLTVDEYRARGPLGRLAYRAYRHPFVMFAIGPAYVFLLKQRLPFGVMHEGSRYWISAMGTNLSILALLSAFYLLGGWAALAFVWLPTVMVAGSVGVWLFYVQHQFEETHWDMGPDWHLHEAALHGSSHYDLPAPLRWLTANIGIHHVHHLYSRIPFYRLPEVLRDHAELVEHSRLTLRSSLACARLNLWHEPTRRLVRFSDLKSL
ncbi:fatty acid desaturase [Aestuariicoccus sp. MJ-SS9]|uniref:fatty acid desaturase n=1 Tax=Aestuariicoccus sp. MJ-SS9 TaxID=3079855 RepID=UPI00290963D1|nr:fatty acid desaturase [Aestuariicoccus sp. MJ-SS9]MDU8909717.1 fatty acid desaturase [Aestuariicoccus sp. MJ-SS9]